MSTKISGYSFLFEQTPVLSTSPYAAGDQLTPVMTLSSTIRGEQIDVSSAYVLQSLVLVDGAQEDAETVVYFFDEIPTVASSVNAPLDITTAELADKCLGWVTVSSYEDLASNSVGCLRNAGLQLKLKSNDSVGEIYWVAKTKGAPTYAANSLTFKFGLALDL